MTLALDDYAACLQDAAPDLRETLDSSYHEAARVMSPAGLQTWLEGAKGLCQLGRGTDLVVTWLQEMPLVAKECGEDTLRDCLEAALKLSSMTSGSVIALLFASLPAAARRLGDPDLLRGYLALVHQLAAKAPRGLRPMLDHIDELLSKLTLSGLRRWAFFGAEAYRRDLDAQVKYFSLATEDSRAVLKRERRGTLFVATQRKLNFTLRAFWGRDFFLRPAAADEGFRPYVERHVLHLPDAVDALAGRSGAEVYRAMATHMAAHVCYTRTRLSAEQLTPAQMVFITLIEDARVEGLAIRDFPGLKGLWRSFLAMERPPAEHPTLDALEGLALALLDDAVRCADPAVDAIARRFHARLAADPWDARLSWDLGMELFHVYAGRRDVPSLRLLEGLRLGYRDDNRIVWEWQELSAEDAWEYLPAHQRQVRKTVSVLEMVNELDNELAGDDAQEVWRLETPFWLDQEECTINELEGKEPISDPYHYPEWDHQVQLHRPDWVTVFERRPPKADPATVDAILTEHRPIAQRIRQIVDALQPQGVQRVRNLEDGDEIDLNAAIDAMVSIRMGAQPDPRITMRNVVKRRDLAVLVLLDLSESTNDPIDDAAPEGKRILDLTREASALVATAIDGIGDPFALHGFSSDGRHDVQYRRFKDFGERWGDDAKARLAGMTGGLSTRMGAAMRHAAAHLMAQPQRRKLLLLVTDGEPADIDERDPQHLRHDTRKAVEELHGQGIMTYCLTLDADADAYVQRIFGPTRYTIVDHVERLPEKLPTLFASLTG